ncbi:HNH endonuclease signature motif containing protein [Brachybacterium phenoliresistens]|uniref:HNH endonuclease signature motif containing protein n=1 Tax=Brachybacterium phenoliresistens TaxID=396014 RepID=UPI0018DC859D|nr:HNH endonuclease signature motif containing protein [Brachybacterium phenoliresistens]
MHEVRTGAESGLREGVGAVLQEMPSEDHGAPDPASAGSSAARPPSRPTDGADAAPGRPEVRISPTTIPRGESWRIEDPRYAHRRMQYRRAMADGTPLPVAAVPDEPLESVAGFVAAAPASTKRIRARDPRTRESLPSRLPEGWEMSEAAQAIWDAGAAEGPVLAARNRALAVLWQPEDDADSDGDCHALVAAQALRVPLRRAQYMIRDAHHAVTTFSACHELLEQGAFPASWFTRMLRDTRDLSTVSREGIDALVSSWDLRIGAERFEIRLREIIRWAEDLEAKQAQQDQDAPSEVERSVGVMDLGRGMSCLQVTGPTPEIASLARRLDVSARAVQAAQRAALKNGDGIPWDVDGLVEQSGHSLRVGVLRYLLLTKASLQTDGIDVPQDRFRLNVTVPVMTLLGRSEAPGTLEGTSPLPADLARALAGGEGTWYRVLTDPCTGAFLPLAATTYRPTAAMLEHLRHLNPTCAVPGCRRAISMGAQADHIEEFLAGGPTSIENLHWLCEHHHQEKTAGLLDPTRLHPARRAADGTWEAGRTRWLIGSGDGHHVITEERDDVDLLGAMSVRRLAEHYRDHPDGPCRRDCLDGARHRPDGPPDPPPEGDDDGGSLPGTSPPEDAPRVIELPSWSEQWPRLWAWMRSEDRRGTAVDQPLPPPPEPPGGGDWGPAGPPPF